MRIVVMGSGGLGGYFGGLLAQSGADVTFVARGAHLQALQERGLSVRSVHGDFTVPVQARADLRGLPPDRKAAISAVREVILANLPKGYEEVMQYGMIGYVVPHSIYPAGYHCNPDQPL